MKNQMLLPIVLTLLTASASAEVKSENLDSYENDNVGYVLRCGTEVFSSVHQRLDKMGLPST